MRRVRVLEVVGDREGGGTQIVTALLARLDPARFECTLVAPSATWLEETCARSGTTFYPLPFMSSRVSASIPRRLRAIIAEVRPDIVHAHGTRAAWFATRALSGGRCAAAFVYSEHLFSLDARRGIAKLPWYAIERTLCRRADVVTTSCQVNAERVLHAHWTTPARITLTHYGIDLERIQEQVAAPMSWDTLHIPDSALVVGAVGRLVPQKGFRYLLEAAARVLEVYPQTVFLIVGDGPLRADLEDRVYRLGIGDSVRFLGRQAQPWRWLAQCDVVALASLYEGLPTAALEALAAARPLVTTRVGGNPEIISSGRTGLLVPPRDAAALAEGILQLLRAPEQRAALGRGAVEVARQYDLRDTLAAFSGIYDALAKTRQAPAEALIGTAVTADRPPLASHEQPSPHARGRAEAEEHMHG